MLTMVLVLLGYLAVWRAVERPTLGRLAADRAGHRGAALHPVLGVLPRRRGRRRPSSGSSGGAAATQRATALRILARDRGRRSALRPVAADVRVPDAAHRHAVGHADEPADERRARHHRLRRRPHDRGLDARPPARAARVARAVRPHARPLEHRRRPAHRRRASAGSGSSARSRSSAGSRSRSSRGSGFQSRYAAVMYPLFALAVAFGAHRARRPPRAVRAARVHRRWSDSSAACATSSRTGRRRRRSPTRSRAAAKPGDVVGVLPRPARSRRRRACCPARLGARAVHVPAASSRRSSSTGSTTRTATPRRRRTTFAQGLLQRAGGHKIWIVWSTGLPDVRRQVRADPQRPRRRPRRPNETLVRPDDKIYEFMGLTDPSGLWRERSDRPRAHDAPVADPAEGA